jgi:hypothetical protein
MHGKLACTRFRLSRNGVPFICSDSNTIEHIQKAQASKACVLPAESSPKSFSLLYCGNYSRNKLLLSRFSWIIDTKTFSFFEYSIKYAYKATLCSKPHEIAAIDRWEKALNHSIEHKWMSMIHYVNDPILNNKSKEKLYKILTRAMPVGRKFDRPGSSISSKCAFCNEYEDEMHCFVRCDRLRALWNWTIGLISHVCPWLSNISDVELLFGFIDSVQNQNNNPYLRIWKVLHAETIRIIWYSRCRKVFDGDDLHVLELKGTIRYRAQTTFLIFAASSRSTAVQIEAWRKSFPLSTLSGGRTNLNIFI